MRTSRPRYRRAAAAALALVATGAAVALARPGDPDRSFDGDGRVLVNQGPAERGTAVAIQPDGKIVVAGGGGADTALTVTRLNPNGSLDTTFDGDGTARVDLGGDEMGMGVAVQPDGRIVAVGSTSVGDNVLAVRLTATGARDPSFGPGGVRTIDYGGDDVGRAVAVQPDGRVLVAGDGGATTAMTLSRLNADGTADTTFDGDGTSGMNLSSGIDRGYGLALLPDGRILVAGASGSPANGAVVRFLSGGSIDGQFGVLGSRLVDYGGASALRAIAVRADGRIVIAGQGGARHALRVSRLTAGGAFDGSFAGGTTGIAGTRDEEATAVALQPNGKVVTVGRTSSGDMIVARFQPGGAPDTTFSSDGRIRINAGGRDGLFGVAVRGSKIIAVGTAGGGDGDVAVLRMAGDADQSVPRCQGRSATVIGTSGKDVLVGTSRRDVIAGLGGDDIIRALGGPDIACGGGGDDNIDGGYGADRLAGGRGDDVCSGGPGRDVYSCERITGR